VQAREGLLLSQLFTQKDTLHLFPVNESLLCVKAVHHPSVGVGAVEQAEPRRILAGTSALTRKREADGQVCCNQASLAFTCKHAPT